MKHTVQIFGMAALLAGCATGGIKDPAVCIFPVDAVAGSGPSTLAAAAALYAKHGENTARTDAFHALYTNGRLWTVPVKGPVEVLEEMGEDSFAVKVRDEAGKEFYVFAQQLECPMKAVPDEQ